MKKSHPDLEDRFDSLLRALTWILVAGLLGAFVLALAFPKVFAEPVRDPKAAPSRTTGASNGQDQVKDFTRFIQEADAGASIADDALGLSSHSVFETPTPEPPQYVTGFPVGGSEPVAYSALPPLIPHSTEGLVPLTLSRNACLGCHNAPQYQGTKRAGFPTAMPESHYQARPGESPALMPVRVDGARYLCTQCHAPRTRAEPLVRNTYGVD